MPDVIKYFIKSRNDEFVIEVPRDWKVTFASVNPASAHMQQVNGYCVRVYEMPGSKLRAVFDSVVSIRDMSIPLARKVQSEVGQTEWKHDSQGNFERNIKVETDSTFELLEDNDPFSRNGG